MDKVQAMRLPKQEFKKKHLHKSKSKYRYFLVLPKDRRKWPDAAEHTL
jgi:hypothetical protein